MALGGINAEVRETEAGWELRLRDQLSSYADEEEAVETARAALATSGGGTIRLFRHGNAWDEIEVPTEMNAFAQAARESTTSSRRLPFDSIPIVGPPTDLMPFFSEVRKSAPYASFYGARIRRTEAFVELEVEGQDIFFFTYLAFSNFGVQAANMNLMGMLEVAALAARQGSSSFGSACPLLSALFSHGVVQIQGIRVSVAEFPMLMARKELSYLGDALTPSDALTTADIVWAGSALNAVSELIFELSNWLEKGGGLVEVQRAGSSFTETARGVGELAGHVGKVATALSAVLELFEAFEA